VAHLTPPNDTTQHTFNGRRSLLALQPLCRRSGKYRSKKKRVIYFQQTAIATLRTVWPTNPALRAATAPRGKPTSRLCSGGDIAELQRFLPGGEGGRTPASWAIRLNGAAVINGI